MSMERPLGVALAILWCALALPSATYLFHGCQPVADVTNRGGTYASQDGPERVPVDAPPGPQRVVVADMDNDSRPDVIIGQAGDPSFQIFYNVSE